MHHRLPNFFVNAENTTISNEKEINRYSYIKNRKQHYVSVGIVFLCLIVFACILSIGKQRHIYRQEIQSEREVLIMANVQFEQKIDKLNLDLSEQRNVNNQLRKQVENNVMKRKMELKENGLEPEKWFQTDVAQEVVLMKTTNTDPSFSMLLFHPKKDFVTNKILRSGFYENDTTKFVEFAIPLHSGKTWIAMDLGVNMGFHSLYMVHRGAHVIGFEPSPDTAELVRANARMNSCLLEESDSKSWWERISSMNNRGSLKIVESAVSNKPGKGTLYRVAESTGLTTLGNPNNIPFDLSPLDRSGRRKNELDENSNNAEVLIQRPDVVLKSLGVPATHRHLRLLKVDVEGYELFALQGIDLNQYPFRYISFEFFPSMIKGCGVEDPVDLLIYVYRQGYRFLELRRGNLKPTFTEHSQIQNSQRYESDIRKWGEQLVETAGSERHFNLFAERHITI